MKRLRILRRWFARTFGFARLMGLAILVGFAVLRVWDPQPIEELRIRVFDGFQRIAPRVKTQRPVTIVDIDEKSLAKFGQWPWPRTRIADMIVNLTNLGALAIGFDMVFSEPDRLNPDVVAGTMRYLDDVTKNKLRELPTNDQILADAIRRSRVILGETALEQVNPNLDKSLPQTGIATRGGDPEHYFLNFNGLLRNISVLETAAAGRGLFTIEPERDGIVRRVPMMLRAQGMTLPSLSFEILRVLTGTPTIMITAEPTGPVKSVVLRGANIPTDYNGQLWIHFAKHDPSIYVSASDVIDGNVAPEKINRKIVLIGTSAVGLNDNKTTPAERRQMPGVEIHAQVIEANFEKALLSEPVWGSALEAAAALVLGLLVVIFAPMFGPVALVLGGGLFASLLIGTSWYFYTQQNLLIDFTYPLLSTTAIYLSMIFSSFVREQAQRRQIRSAFGQYLSPALVEQLAQSPEKLVLGGEEREMTSCSPMSAASPRSRNPTRTIRKA